jgi:hypothetical protein
MLLMLCGVDWSAGANANASGGIRFLLLVYWRCPCAGRHLLFFAAAKKSRGGFKLQVQQRGQ